MATYDALGQLLGKYPNFDLGINSVFCLANQESMDETIEFVNTLDRVRTHTISLIRGEVSDGRQKEVDMERYHAAIKKLESNLKKKRSRIYGFSGAKLKAAQDILQRRLIHETAVQKRQIIPCYAGRLNLVITETGDLYPCESFTMKIGNLRDDGFDIQRLMETDRAQKVIRSIRNNGCYCTHECYFMTNILFNPSL